MRPRVRSTRNVIYVEAERTESAPAAKTAATEAAISLTGPSPAIRDLRVQKRGEATAVTLLGTSRLIATSVIEPKDGPRRVVVNLPNVTSSLPTTTNVGQGPVQRVRIGFDPKAPLMTQVTVDLYEDGALPGRDIAGRQRPDARVRRAGGRSVQRAADAELGSPDS